MKKVVGSLLFVGCLTVSYAVSAKRKSIVKTTQALTAQNNINGLNARLKQAKADLKEIQEKIDQSISRSDKRKLSTVQSKITKLQKQERDIRNKINKSIPEALEKRLENKKLEINYLEGQISILMKHLEPYFPLVNSIPIVA